MRCPRILIGTSGWAVAAIRDNECNLMGGLIAVMKGKQISLGDHLYDATEADVVPSGVGELAKLQAQGYAYIKL